MKLTFLGTRGGITARSKLHYRHSSLLIEYYTSRILIDRGTDWLNKPYPIDLDGILITHAHPDHAEGLQKGTPYNVYAPTEPWERHDHTPRKRTHLIKPYKPFHINKFTCTAFPVRHSLNAPAVGYKVTAGKRSIFYAPDLVSIIRQRDALKNVDAYIGDGAIITRIMLIRRKEHTVTGHAPIIHQLEWCQKENIKHMIVTHCGTEITTGQQHLIEKKLRDLANTYNVKVTLAHDGMTLTI